MLAVRLFRANRQRVVVPEVMTMSEKQVSGAEEVIEEVKAGESSRDMKQGVVAGNFELGECFCDVRCRYGHETRLFNIGRGHFVACDGCRTFLCVGSNLMSSWRSEDKKIWQKNGDSVNGYEFVAW